MTATFDGIFTSVDNEAAGTNPVPSEQDEGGILAWISAKWQWCCRNWMLLAGCALGLTIAAAFYALLGSIIAALFGASIATGATYGAIAGAVSGVWSMFSNRELLKAAAR